MNDPAFWRQLLAEFGKRGIHTFDDMEEDSLGWHTISAHVDDDDGFSYTLTHGEEIRVCFRCDMGTPNHRMADFIFDRLLKQKNEIKSDFGLPLEWQSKKDGVAPNKYHICFSRPRASLKDEHDDVINWMAKYIVRLERATRERFSEAKKAWERSQSSQSQ